MIGELGSFLQDAFTNGSVGEALLVLWEELASYIEQGGLVMWPLVAATAVLWFGLGYRLLSLTRGGRPPAHEAVSRYRRDPHRRAEGFVAAAVVRALEVRRTHRGDIGRVLDEQLQPLTDAASKYRTLVRTIVVIAPLAGLLGTVGGMIEMFDSLADQTFYSQSGGVANGISQALFTTQFGLVIAIPGMIVGRLLDRREDVIVDEIEQVKVLVSEPAAGGTTP